MNDTGQQTRLGIIAAFNRLVLSTRRARPPIASLLREAGVARSTLYKHFDDRESLLLEAMRGPLSVMASALCEPDQESKLEALLQHFWEHKQQAADILSGRLSVRMVRALAAELAPWRPELERADLLRIADAQMGLLRLWVTGETPCAASVLTAKMIASADAQGAALRNSGF